MHTRMRKLWIAALFLIVSVCLSACVKAEFEVTIKENGKADISILYAFADSLAQYGDTGSMSMEEEEMEEMRKEGWTVEEYSADGYTGNRMSKKDADLSELELGDDAETSVVKEGSTYTVNLRLMDEEEASSMQESAALISSMGGSFKLKLNLPVKPIEHNATTVSEDGKSLEWDLLKMDPTEPVHVVFKMSNPLMPIVIAALILAVLAIAFVIFVKKKRNVEPAPVTPAPEPAAAGFAPEGTAPVYGDAAPAAAAFTAAAAATTAAAAEAPASAASASPEAPAPVVPEAPVSTPAAPAVPAAPAPAAPAVPEAPAPSPAAPAPAAPAAPPAPAPAPAAPRRICANCGAELPEGASFCGNCGVKYVAPVIRKCSNCGAILSEGNNFCPNCGTKYEPAAPAPEAPKED